MERIYSHIPAVLPLSVQAAAQIFIDVTTAQLQRRRSILTVTGIGDIKGIVQIVGRFRALSPVQNEL